MSKIKENVYDAFKTLLSVLAICIGAGFSIHNEIVTACSVLLLMFLLPTIGLLLIISLIEKALKLKHYAIIIVWLLCDILLVPTLAMKLDTRRGLDYLEKQYIKNESIMWEVANTVMNAAPDSCYLRIDIDEYPTRQELRDKGITDSLAIENLLKNLNKTKCRLMFCNKRGDTKRIEYTRHYLGGASEGYLFLLDGSDPNEMVEEDYKYNLGEAFVYSDSVLFTIHPGATGNASFPEKEKQAFRNRHR